MTKTSKTIDGVYKLISLTEVDNPQIAPFAKGAQAVIKAQGEEFEKPETWESFKTTTLMIMGYIPAAIPFVAPASLVFDIIIASLKAEQS
jgi:hypothetical protein